MVSTVSCLGSRRKRTDGKPATALGGRPWALPPCSICSTHPFCQEPRPSASWAPTHPAEPHLNVTLMTKNSRTLWAPRLWDSCAVRAAGMTPPGLSFCVCHFPSSLSSKLLGDRTPPSSPDLTTGLSRRKHALYCSISWMNVNQSIKLSCHLMYLLSTKQICPFLFSYVFILITRGAHDYIFTVSDSNTTEKSQFPLALAHLHFSAPPGGSPTVGLGCLLSALLVCVDVPLSLV